LRTVSESGVQALEQQRTILHERPRQRAAFFRAGGAYAVAEVVDREADVTLPGETARLRSENSSRPSEVWLMITAGRGPGGCRLTGHIYKETLCNKQRKAAVVCTPPLVLPIT
jgi:hypothetical protein